jgi:glycosyltransferase involved in cell wall biosynthesis
LTLISCVLPTRGRRELAQKAVDCFLAQDYPNRELVILDDADETSFPEGVTHPLVRYFRTSANSERMTIPPKRNAVNALTEGSVIAHLDSDDWSSPDRLSHQMQLMEESGKALIGYHSILFYENDESLAKYNGDSDYAIGTSLFYRKSFWEAHPFEESKHSKSDNLMVRHARDEYQLHSVDAEHRMVARVHPGNTGLKQIYKYPFRKASLDMFPQEFLTQGN